MTMQQPLHICYVEMGYPHAHGGGGAGAYVRLTGRELVRRGHSVTVVTDACRHCPAHDWDEGISVHRNPQPGRLHWYLNKAPGLNWAALSVRYLVDEGWKLYRFLEDLHRREPISIVEFSEGGDFWHAFRSPFPTLAHLHGSRFTFLRQSGRRVSSADWRQRRLELLFIRRAHRIVSPSKGLARVVRAELKRKRTAEVILPYPLDPALLEMHAGASSCKASGRNVMFAARDDVVKGADVLLQAAPLVRAQAPDACFTLIGRRRRPGDLEAEWLRCHPFMNRDELYRHYQSADVCVAPSLWDNSPNTIYEAMACGKAIVASRVGGIPDLVEDGKTGLLVPPGDHQSLARAIVRLLTNDQERTAMGRAGRERIVSIADLAENVTRRLALYEQVIEEFKRSARGARRRKLEGAGAAGERT